MRSAIPLIALLALFFPSNAFSNDYVVQESFGKLPLYFIENQGQVDGEVAYYVKGSDKILYFTSSGITFSLNGGPNENTERWIVKLDFVGANRSVKPRGENKEEAIFSFFKGKPDQWKTAVSTYGKVVYEDLWPGIDLVYSGTVNRLKYDFIVKPGADPNDIRLNYRGAENVSIKDTGELMITTPLASFADGRPSAYQWKNEKQNHVTMRYVLIDNADNEGFSYGFEVGPYDEKLPLILDPALLVYCGYIGGSLSDYCYSIAVDTKGNAYVTGKTSSDESSFPVTTGPDLTFNGTTTSDAFVAKVSTFGYGLFYCGYIGGGSTDEGSDIAVDDKGNAYVVGWTGSDETGFPVAVGPDLTFNGISDAFVAKISEDGTHLEYCGYIGGNDTDYGYGVAVDSSGRAYVTGEADSDESSFPVAVGPDLTINQGTADAFVARVNAQGTGLEYCGYIGGDLDEEGRDIEVDGEDRAYVAGSTNSDETTFPVLVGPDLTFSGNIDLFVARVNSQGSGLEYCGYIGGEETEYMFHMALDDHGNAYVAGSTLSDESTFPVTVGPDLTYNGLGDAFITKINSQGTAYTYCGYIGGDLDDIGRGVDVDLLGNAYVIGSTFSDENSFPVTVGPDLTHNGHFDAFIAKVNPQGTGFKYCGYLGGDSQDTGFDVAVDRGGNPCIAGSTRSDEATFPVTTGPDLTYNGSDEAFVAKITEGLYLDAYTLSSCNE